LLQEVRFQGRWEAWLEFFLNGIEQTAKQILVTTQKMNELFEEATNKINALGRAKFSCLLVFEHLKKLPQISVSLMSKELGISEPTARASLNHLLELNIVKEISGQKRDKIYVYKDYLAILEEGTTPLS